MEINRRSLLAVGFWMKGILFYTFLMNHKRSRYWGRKHLSLWLNWLKGKSIIMISSSMPELISMSDRWNHATWCMIDVESRTVTEEDLIKRSLVFEE